MEMQNVKITGFIKFDLFNEKGELKQHEEIHNVIVTVGKEYLATWLTAATQSGYFMQYLALGTGTNAANSSQTALQTELSTRVAGTLSNSSTVWQNQGTFAPGVDTGTISVAGIFSASSGGTMLARQTFAGIVKGAGDALQVTWQVTIS